MQHWNKLEALASELKSLIGYGAKAHHVIARPVLRDLVAQRYPGLETRALRQVIIEELRRVADEPSKELLALSRVYSNRNAVVRRENVIRQTNAACSVDAWRKPDGPEMELMRDLARALLAEDVT